MTSSHEGNFKIILTGSVNPDFSLPEVEQRLSQSFNVAPAQIKPLLQGRPTVLKTGLTTAQAEKYRHALAQAGVEFRIVEESPQLSLVPRAEDSTTAAVDSGETPPAGLPVCPKCGYRAKQADDPLLTKYNGLGECPKCGIIPRNYLAIQRERQDSADAPRQSDSEKFQRTSPGHLVNPILGLFLNKNAAYQAVALMLILSVIFGSGLVINTLFFTRNYHVLYQIDAGKRGCFSFIDAQEERNPMIGRVMSEYNDYFKKTIKSANLDAFFQRYSGKICIHAYSVEIGNIGKLTVENLKFRMDEDLFKGLFADGQPHLHLHFKVENLNAANPRNGDPTLTQGDSPNLVVIKNLSPGTYMQIFFFGLHAEKDAPVGWKNLLRSTHIDQGDVDEGNPRATVLGRILL